MRKFIRDVPLKSIFHLFLVRGSIYLFPFITLPVITRSLGVTQFGILSMFLAAQQYLIMLVEYGFTLTGARDISRAVHKYDENKILSEILKCRFLIFLVCTIFVVSTYFLLPEYGYSFCYLILLMAVLSSVCNQTHFFIGKERTGFIVISTAIARILSILIVVLFVRNKDDIYIAMLAYSLNVALPNILSIFYLQFLLKYNSFYKTSWEGLVLRFKSGFDIFISNVFTNVYSTLTLIYLGSVRGPTETGYYSSAEKLKAAAQGVLSPIAQAFFPRISRKEGREFYLLWRKSTLILVGFSVFIVTGLLLFSQLIYKIFLGQQYFAGLPIYYILSFSIISISFGIAYAQNLYLTQGKTKLLRMIYFVVSILHIIHMPLLVHFFGAIGAALSVLITETLASLLMFIFRKKCFLWSQT
ncbi:oligosaccharide flippase family protein [Enterobacter hormaechei]|uniref:oligosaccharide flippase family protein n=1 Tax=Enterobacter hormaechei TaxID=158836 RepID=UPI00088E3FA8|nr:oligosaccharide flippase family protein [Enterobacter hormaechei]SCZ25106.1 polysaccharide transporter, PST family [Enterobacter hormaechei]